MPEVRFNLKDSSKDGKTLIYLISNFNNQRFKYSTGQRIHPKFWDKKAQIAITKKTHPKLKNNRIQITSKEINSNKAINNELGRYKDQFDRIYDNMVFNSEIPTIEKIKDKMDEAFRDNQKTKSIQKTLNQYFNDFIEDIEKGNRLTDSGKKYEKGTVKSLRGTLTQFEDFQKEKKRQYNFDDINIDVHEEFMNFFNDKNYSLNTIGRHIKNLKTIMRNSKEEGLHNNTEFERRAFKAHKTEVTNIYLDETELRKLFEIDLSDKIEWDIARDVFLIGCYTGLRYSDYSRINKHHIAEKNGYKYIDIITKKTGERVIIPMRREVEEILKKYNYNIPKTHEQKINKHIKKIGEKAGIEEMIEVESIKGGLKVNTKVPKHDLIKTHTARRSAATNMYLAGIPSIDIMKITGHTKESSFLKYICVTKEQTASNLANHEYFNAKKIKVV